MAKKFFYVCAGILMLVAAYSLGAQRVEAQVGGGDFVALVSANGLIAITNNGDVYKSSAGVNWSYLDNIRGGAVSSDAPALDEVKALYR